MPTADERTGNALLKIAVGSRADFRPRALSDVGGAGYLVYNPDPTSTDAAAGLPVESSRSTVGGGVRTCVVWPGQAGRLPCALLPRQQWTLGAQAERFNAINGRRLGGIYVHGLSC